MKQVLLFLTTVLFSAFVHAQDGTRDMTFGTNGIAKTELVTGGASVNALTQDLITKMTVQKDGKIVQVGYMYNPNIGNNDFVLIRYDQNGMNDGSFGNQAGKGWTLTDVNNEDNRAHSVAIQNDGKIVVAGENINGPTHFFVVLRYNPDGKTLDNSFGGGDGIVVLNNSGNNAVAFTVEIQPDGKILAGGWASNGSANTMVLARFKTDGSPDGTFGAGGLARTQLSSDDGVTDIELLPNGKIVSGGWTNTGNRVFALTLHSSSGALDPSFGTGGIVKSTVLGEGRSLAFGGNQKIYFSGIAPGASSYDFTTLSYNLDGKPNTGFGGTGVVQTHIAGDDFSRSVLVQCDGKVIVGGDYSIFNFFSYAVVRYNTNGTLDPSFNSTGKFTFRTGTGIGDFGISGLAFQDQKIILAGVSLPSFTEKFHPTAIRLNNSVGSVGSITPATADICQGDFVQLTVTGGTSYQWSRNGTPISGATSSVYTATQAGTYSVIVTNGTCSGPASNTAVVSVTPLPTGSISPDNAAICPGGNQVLTATGGTSYQWSRNGTAIPGATANTYTATVAGTYSVRIFSGDCSAPASNTATITVGTAPTGSISPAGGSICPGDSIKLTATGGISYQWSVDNTPIPGATSAVYYAKQAGTYRVAIFNGSCTGQASNTAVVTTGTAPTGSITPSNGTICPGESILLTATGGTSYQWRLNNAPISGATAATYNATQPGTYSVTIFNGNCSGQASNSAVINAGTVPTGSITPSNGSICPGDSIQLTVTGGTSYQWRLNNTPITGATSATYFAKQAGNYSVTIFNGNCSGPASNTAAITTGTVPSGNISPASGSICSGDSLKLTATGGTSYQWKLNNTPIAGATSAAYFAKQAGTYSVTIFNNNCSGPASNTAVITTSAAPTGNISPSNGSICPGDSLQLTANGGTSYQWKLNNTPIAGATSATYFAKQAGTYSVTIFNGNCSGPASNTAVITTGTTPTGSISPASGSLCTGDSLKLTATGGTSYQWSLNNTPIPGATTATYFVKQAGTYSVIITNGSCSGPASNTAVITTGTAPSGSITPASGTICTGDSLKLTATGGTSYQWRLNNTPIPGATSATYYAKQAGTYSVVIFSGSCSGPASNTAVITTGTAPTGSITPSNGSICPGDSLQLTATGGTSYQWRLNNTPIPGATTAIYFAKQAGTYSVVITNGSCSGPASNTAVITTGTAPSGNISPASGSICTGDSLQLTATGGTSYQWSLNNNPIAGATSATYYAKQAGTYSVMIFNGNCSGPASNNAVITTGTAPTGSISPANGSICPGDSLQLTATGGTSYQWSLNNTPIPGATLATYFAKQAGTYRVMIFNGSCSGPASNTAVISTGTAPSGSISPASGSLCTGDSLKLTATGGTSYQWSLNNTPIPGATSATYFAKQAGTYSVVLFNGNCSGPASNTVVIAAGTAPTGSITPASGTICTGDSLQLTATGGTSYQWSLNNTPIPGATTATYYAKQAGTYSVTIFNGNCSGQASNTAVITTSATPSGSISPASGAICTGDSLKLTATGGTSYQWSVNGTAIPGSTSATYYAKQAGTYSVIIFNGNCSGPASNSAVITTGTAPSGSITPANGSICIGDSLKLTATGGTSYQWSLNGTTIQGTTSDTYYAKAAGTYSVIITNGSCSGPASNTSVITTGTSPTGNISPASGSICPGDSLQLTATGGTSYQWSINNAPIPGATSAAYYARQAGTYSVLIFSGSCSGPASNTAVITTGTAPSGSITPTSGSICSGDSLQLTATGGTSYQWSLNNTPIPGAITATYFVKQAGTYSVIITNGSCSGPASNTAVITTGTTPTGSISPANGSICPSDSLQLTATGGTSYQWSLDGTDIPMATSATYYAKTAGTYSVTIFNGNCSGPASNIAVITAGTAPSGNISPASGSICTGDSLKLTATGGTSYQWSLNGTVIPGATSATYYAKQAGTYSVVINNGSCSGPASNNAVITAGTTPSGSISPASGSICTGDSLQLTATGGTSYQWSINNTPIPGATSAIYFAKQAGTYSATIFNGNCSGPSSNTAVITTGTAPTGSISPSNGSICSGDSLQLTATGGNSYQWSLNGTAIPGATSATYFAKQAGTYSVMITNGSCSGPASNNAVVTSGTAPSGNITPASGTICTGDSLQLTATGGTSYQWSLNNTPIPGATSSTYLAKQAGTYSVVITNGSCSGPASNTAVITTGTAPSGSINPANGSICTGDSLKLTATGGTSYQWALDGTVIPGATSANYFAKQAGTYSVTIFNGNCSGPASNTAVITAGTAPTGSISPTSGSICPGDSLQLSATGGTSYQWSLNNTPIPGATSATFFAKQAGTYSVIITNGNCSGPASNSAVITAGTAPGGSISPSSGSICTGDSLQLTATGGTSYQWSLNGTAIPGATSATYNAKQAGTYSVTIFNGNCSGPASNTAVITAGTVPTGSISPASGSICSGDSLQLTANGGTSYQWSLDGTVIPGATSAVYYAKAAGTYSVLIITGSCSGPASNTAVISTGTAPSGNISPASGSICSGDSIQLIATGGTSYQWSLNNTPIPGATSATYFAKQAGTYSVTIFNGSCSGPASNTAVITAGTAPSGSITPASGSICTGDSLQLTATGGTSYQWNLNNTPITGATSATYFAKQAGTFSVTIINGNCSGPASNTAVITTGTAPSGSISPANGSICTGDSLKLTATGGTTYQWSLNGTAIPGATSDNYFAKQAGTYSVTIFSGSCSGPASNTAVITIGTAPSGNISPNSGSICSGDSLQLTATGGTSYQWALDGTVIPGVTSATYFAKQAGTYSVIITNGSCSGPASNTAVITTGTAPSGSINPESGSICTGDSLKLTATGGTSYQWSLNNTPIAGATSATYYAKQTGTYSVLIFSGSCSGPALNSAMITVGTAPTGTISPAGGSICTGDSLQLTATGGTSYQWSLNGTAIPGAISALYYAKQAGTYSVLIINGSCSGPASNTAVITTGAAPDTAITAGGATAFCTGGSVSLQAGDAAAYQWYRNDSLIGNATGKTFTATESGVYKVKVSNTGSCSAVSNGITVTVTALPAGSITSTSGIVCPDSPVTLTATGGTSYQWYLNGAAISGATGAVLNATAAGTYSADIIGDNNCKAKASNEITLSPANLFTADFDFNEACQGQQVDFVNKSDTTNAGAIEWLWYFGDKDSAHSFSPSHTYPRPGNYTVTLIAKSNSCAQRSDTVRKVIGIKAGTQGMRYFMVRAVMGQPYPLAARDIGTKYLWQPSADLDDATSRTPVVTPTQERTYTVSITAGNGCVTTDTLLVQVFNRKEVFVPKAFTPDGNGVNDLLRPILVDVPHIHYFRVYNRWGQLLFETKTPGDGWNGTYKGLLQPTETYTWVFEGKDLRGSIIRANGKSILMR